MTMTSINVRQAFLATSLCNSSLGFGSRRLCRMSALDSFCCVVISHSWAGVVVIS
jgi:hypothetical protein